MASSALADALRRQGAVFVIDHGEDAVLAVFRCDGDVEIVIADYWDSRVIRLSTAERAALVKEVQGGE